MIIMQVKPVTHKGKYRDNGLMKLDWILDTIEQRIGAYEISESPLTVLLRVHTRIVIKSPLPSFISFNVFAARLTKRLKCSGRIYSNYFALTSPD